MSKYGLVSQRGKWHDRNVYDLEWHTILAIDHAKQEKKKKEEKK